MHDVYQDDPDIVMSPGRSSKLQANTKLASHKKSLILPKISEENRNINIENMRMLKRILS